MRCDFVYMRLHGDKQLYASGYTCEALKRWGDRIDAWSHGKQPPDAQLIDHQQKPKARKTREVFCYFDNDLQVRAPFDARSLLQHRGLDVALATEPRKSPEPGVLP